MINIQNYKICKVSMIYCQIFLSRIKICANIDLKRYNINFLWF